MMRYVLMVFALCFVGVSLSAQTDTLVRFTSNFQFKDGLYFNIQEFKDNCPGVKSSDILDKKGRSTHGEWTRSKRLYHMVNDTLRQIESKDIWGYSNNGKVFLTHEGRHKRLQIIGSICHIVLIDEVEEFTNNGGNYEIGRARYDGRMIMREVNTDYIIDFEEGDMYELDLDYFMQILSRDDALFVEFDRLESRRMKEKLIFHYLTKYNKKHPIYFSINRCVKKDPEPKSEKEEDKE